MRHYSKSLLGVKYLRDGGNIQTEELIEKFAKEIELPVNLNLALCNIKVKNYPYAIHHATQVLEFDPDNCKALYRRGVGLRNTANVIACVQGSTKRPESTWKERWNSSLIMRKSRWSCRT
eukprot:TRINITY_DN5238_c0_g1_i5.p3 TRINITY_DN5238_c0_g1~~TRINITY_DN5238_c0_g1_i5.p3  ORF type:complete len:120 (-),score=21.97 TRINITY_DN5238_c0_g1_i5:377-736(-)